MASSCRGRSYNCCCIVSRDFVAFYRNSLARFCTYGCLFWVFFIWLLTLCTSNFFSRCSAYLLFYSRFGLNFFLSVFNTASSADRSDSTVSERILELNPILLPLWHWQSYAKLVTNQLDLIHLSLQRNKPPLYTVPYVKRTVQWRWIRVYRTSISNMLRTTFQHEAQSHTDNISQLLEYFCPNLTYSVS